jgi:hypothetical protein
VAVSLGFLFFDRARFVLSDNHYTQVSPQVTQTNQERPQSEPVVLESIKPDNNQKVSYEGPSNSKVGRPLSEAERQLIEQILGETSSKNVAVAFAQTPKLILHDTSGELSDSTVEHKAQIARGPLGNGVTAYISRQGRITIARPNFFDPRRPTATVYEKVADLLPESLRNQEVRRVWQATATPLRQAALKNVVAGLGVDETSLMQRATTWLNSTSDEAFDTLQARSSTSFDGAKTTGLWAMAQVCYNVVKYSDRADRIASSPQTVSTLKNACQKVDPVLKEYRDRVSASLHVELIQMKGSECFITDTQVKAYNQNAPDSMKIKGDRVVSLQTWERPAYTPEQYQSLVRLYLQSALQADRFPEITTHYWVDQGTYGKIGTHCDPRGLDLMYLYQQISATIGDPLETIYGIEPKYGLHPEKGDNLWWSEAVLGDLPPKTTLF